MPDERTGFLEEAPQVKSSSRLGALAAVTTACVLALVHAWGSWYVILHAEQLKDDATVLGIVFGATAGVISVLLAGAWAAFVAKTRSDAIP